MHDMRATEMLALPIAQLINSLPLEKSSRSFITAVMAVLEASRSRLSSINSCHVTSYTELEV